MPEPCNNNKKAFYPPWLLCFVMARCEYGRAEIGLGKQIRTGFVCVCAARVILQTGRQLNRVENYFGALHKSEVSFIS